MQDRKPKKIRPDVKQSRHKMVQTQKISPKVKKYMSDLENLTSNLESLTRLTLKNHASTRNCNPKNTGRDRKKSSWTSNIPWWKSDQVRKNLVEVRKHWEFHKKILLNSQKSRRNILVRCLKPRLNKIIYPESKNLNKDTCQARRSKI